MHEKPKAIQRKPDWLRVRLSGSPAFKEISALVHDRHLNTVCESAMCPNIHECWGTHKTATFMILGDTCTRACRFCAVPSGKPQVPDPQEPARVGDAVKSMGIRHAVVTMVTRDDLPDGGASFVADTVLAIRNCAPGCTVEVLVSDMNLNPDAIRLVAAARPDINSHNLETVRRLTPQIRSRSDYDRSLAYLRKVKESDPGAVTKSSLMLGLGETREEILESMGDMRGAGVDILNLGQYLQPTARHAPVVRYWTPDEFAELKEQAMGRGFAYCQSGPMVRSSYHAGDQYGDFLRNLRAAR
jgi:lipoic acid synthetase